MLIPHHWLGFILLAVLMSPACAVPLERRNVHYHMKLLNVNGLEVEKITSGAQEHLRISITSLAKEMGDGGVPTIDHSPHLLDMIPTFNPSAILYYGLEGGKHCSSSADKTTLVTCFGFVVSLPKDLDNLDLPVILFSAVISRTVDGNGLSSFQVFHQPLPAELTSEQLEKAKVLRDTVYSKFLVMFVPIHRWVILMAHGTRGDEAPDPVVKDAAAVLLRSRRRKAQKGTIPLQMERLRGGGTPVPKKEGDLEKAMEGLQIEKAPEKNRKRPLDHDVDKMQGLQFESGDKNGKKQKTR
ncbi:hypothetical protein BDP27DRAFT_1419068 [Rhodocollybia butyracea]|uniref:Uncharacterized protein n=1 Tax=Rhodocollybia butyracea TaxID=206335 RepID=A0A9P5PSI7_9AGAR|nr:hypothetical protein BDP27DRAFT_1419068 [Rhodocollybia butyracea]